MTGSARRRGERAAGAAGKRAAGDALLRGSILRWYRKHRRDLPWRRTRDPYAVWVSEIMLQQTRVETVIPFYERFLERFPTVESLARAPEADVLAAWSGLGYYSRASSLRSAAATVVREHAGRLPEDPAALGALPGIGPYTAAAIASIAYDRPVAAVDGNVIRVLARIAGLTGRRDSPALKGDVARVAEGLARGSSPPGPGDWTQALMELGALVCLPRDPRCHVCPAVRRCVARASGEPSLYPGPAKAAAAPAVARHVLLVARRGRRILVVPWEAPRAGTKSGAAWTLPTASVSARAANARSAARKLARALVGGRGGAGGAASGGDPDVTGPRARFRHRTYSQNLDFEVWETSARGAVRPRGAGRWVDPSALATLPLRAPTIKALKRLQAPSKAHRGRD